MCPLRYVPLPLTLALALGCATSPLRKTGPAQYTARIIYCNEHFNGASLSDQTLLVFPVLSRTGHDTASYFSPEKQIEILQKVRKDLRFSRWNAFEKKYLFLHDSLSLSRFYQSLYKGEVVKLQTSDSIWKAMDAPYMLFARIRYAVTIRSFDGNSRRNLHLDVELWDVSSCEAVWRVEASGLDASNEMTDARFLSRGLFEAFSKLPGYVPANNENTW